MQWEFSVFRENETIVTEIFVPLFLFLYCNVTVNSQLNSVQLLKDICQR